MLGEEGGVRQDIFKCGAQAVQDLDPDTDFILVFLALTFCTLENAFLLYEI